MHDLVKTEDCFDLKNNLYTISDKTETSQINDKEHYSVHRG